MTKEKFLHFIDCIIANHEHHARWINTLSLMENIGAKKIIRSEHSEKTNVTVLKHAAEEARHAYFLKHQLQKINDTSCPTYESIYLFSPVKSKNYLHKLDVAVCRFLKKQNQDISREELVYFAYLFVTYLIEVRAEFLYDNYQDKLSEHKSKVNVKSIIAEEESHLKDMKNQIRIHYPNWKMATDVLTKEEDMLFFEWITDIQRTISI